MRETLQDRKLLTVLMEQLMDGSFLRVKEERGHVVVASVGTEELAEGGVDVFTAPHLQTDVVSRLKWST